MIIGTKNENIKTLNEEISRMKSLFGDERLYGNLVKENKVILTEQVKSLKGMQDDIVLGLLKDRKSYTFKAPKENGGKPQIKNEKNKNGDMVWYRGDKVTPTMII